MTRRIAVLAFERCQSLDVTGPFEVFAEAVDARRARGQSAGYTPLLVTLDGKPVRSSGGVGLMPASSLAQAVRRGIDTLIVAGGEGARLAAREASVVAQVRRAARKSRRVASVCTGAFVLAAAGLLDGRRATTHFAFCGALAEDFPKVQVEAEPIYVRDGSLWTSAGVTAGIDLALALVEQDFGPELSLGVARQLVVFVRRAGGQSQFSPQLLAQTKEPGPLRDVQAYITEHPDAALAVPELARRARMSVRNFSRVFRSRLGMPPAEYVECVRVDAAKRFLESSDRSVEGVASAVGFGTPEALRRAFARRVGLSPREYRSRFGRV
ncbi:MAG: GlxA family transcriptional regulator [Polyangiaceae bacterium]